MGLKIWVQERQKYVSGGCKGQYKIKTFATSSLKLKKRKNVLPCVDCNFSVARNLLLDSSWFYMIRKLKLPPNFCMTVAFHWQQANIYFMLLSPSWQWFFKQGAHRPLPQFCSCYLVSNIFWQTSSPERGGRCRSQAYLTPMSIPLNPYGSHPGNLAISRGRQ